MNLTTKQVAEKLGVDSSTINNWARSGKLKPTNNPKEGKSRFNRLFNSADINKFKAENGITPRKRRALLVDSGGSIGPLGFGARLERIESKIDRLLKIWS